jgi:hypothetical protein
VSAGAVPRPKGSSSTARGVAEMRFNCSRTRKRWFSLQTTMLCTEPGSARELARRLAWAEAFPEKMRQMGECAQADYLARFVADWNWQRLYGERRRQNRGQSRIS